MHPVLQVLTRVSAWSAAIALTGLSLASLAWNPFAAFSADARPGSHRAIEVISDDGRTRVIRHIGGLTAIPSHPQRICALAFVDELLTLGVQPATVPGDWRGKVQDYLSNVLVRPRVVPQAYASWLPSFEAVAAVKPDLILISPNDLHEYRQFAAIAPTVIVRDAMTANRENSSIDALKRRVLDLGAVIGRTTEAEAAIAGFDRHTALARTAIHDTMRGKTIAFFRTREREWRLYGRRGDNGAQAVYDALDLRAPKMISDRGLTALDPESLVGFDVDYLVVVGDETLAARQTFNRLNQNPLWHRVTAVRQHHVLELTVYRHWVASGLLGKTRMIDEFVQCIRGSSL